jgi:hypothetical protein
VSRSLKISQIGQKGQKVKIGSRSLKMGQGHLKKKLNATRELPYFFYFHMMGNEKRNVLKKISLKSDQY